LTAALDLLAARRELISKFVDTAIVVAKAGASARVSSLLEKHPQGSTLEPLAIAIKLIRGENPVVATEVMAVAKDIAETTKNPT
jgi:hypothetical protein